VHMANRVRKKWTLEELDSLPDDGNRYELIHGDLLVTPPPTVSHGTILARLTRILARMSRRTAWGTSSSHAP
jgi:Uma2 family endonuclease